MHLNPGTTFSRIATAALSLHLKGAKLTKETIAVEAWAYYPKRFTMRGYDFIDSNRVYAKLGTLVKEGILGLLEDGQYTVARTSGIPWPPSVNAQEQDGEVPDERPELPDVARPAPVLPENAPHHARLAHRQALVAAGAVEAPGESLTVQRVATAPKAPRPNATPAFPLPPSEAPPVARQELPKATEPPAPPKSLVQLRSDLLPTVQRAVKRPAANPTGRAPVQMTPAEPLVVLTPSELADIQTLRRLPIVEQSQRGLRAPTRADAIALWGIPVDATDAQKPECRRRIEARQQLLRRAMQSIGPTTPPALRSAIHTLFGLERTLSATFGAEYKESSAA